MMSLWDALRMNMMISYQELVRTFHSVNDGKGCIHDCTIKQIVFLLVLFSQS